MRPLYLNKSHCRKQLFEWHLPLIPFQQHQSQLYTMNHVIKILRFRVNNWDCFCWNGTDGRCRSNSCFVQFNFLMYIWITWFMVCNWDWRCWDGIDIRCLLNTCIVQCNSSMYIGLKYRKESIGIKCSLLDEDLNWWELVLAI